MERPFDPDDLPLESERAGDDSTHEDEHRSRSHDAVATADQPSNGQNGSGKLSGRPFRIRLPGRNATGR